MLHSTLLLPLVPFCIELRWFVKWFNTLGKTEYACSLRDELAT